MQVMSNGRVRRSERERQEILARWAKSGVSAREFCRKEEIQFSSFQRWQQKLNGSPASIPPREDFVPVNGLLRPSPPGPSPWSLEVTLPNGVALRFQG
jgi:hypothetical protein